MQYGKKQIPLGFILGAIIYLGYCWLFTPNFYISIPVVLFPILAFKLFWIDRQLSVLFWGMMLQWLTASTQLVYCNLLGVTLEEKMKNSAIPSSTMEMATLLSIIGLYAFSLGLYLAVKNLRFSKIESLIDQYSPRGILLFYLAFSLIIYLTSNIIWSFPGIVQYVYGLFYIKWGFFVVVFYLVHKGNQKLRWYFYGLIFVEIFLGLNSFFAREILFTTMFAMLAILQLRPKLNLKSYLLFTIGALLITHYLILWSAVKQEYRQFLTKGVSVAESRDKYITLMTTVDSKHYREGIEQFVNRLGYIQLFGACLDYVPRVVPYQNGQIYLSAVQHYLVPRFLNPNKEILDDSKHTEKFTGVHVSGRKEATSISLGYVADAYVDFGYIYMHLLLLAVGWFFGFTYRVLVIRSPNTLWVWVLTGPFVFLVNIYGADTKKAIGGLIIYFFTILIVRSQLIKVVESFIRLRTVPNSQLS